MRWWWGGSLCQWNSNSCCSLRSPALWRQRALAGIRQRWWGTIPLLRSPLGMLCWMTLAKGLLRPLPAACSLRKAGAFKKNDNNRWFFVVALSALTFLTRCSGPGGDSAPCFQGCWSHSEAKLIFVRTQLTLPAEPLVAAPFSSPSATFWRAFKSPKLKTAVSLWKRAFSKLF